MQRPVQRRQHHRKGVARGMLADEDIEMAVVVEHLQRVAAGLVAIEPFEAAALALPLETVVAPAGDEGESGIAAGRRFVDGTAGGGS